jgi:hypothetical protein
MKRILILSPCFLVIFLISCSGETQNEVTDQAEVVDTLLQDSIILDSIIIEIDANRNVIDVENLFSKTDQTFELPLIIDSTFISKYASEEKSNLSFEEARHLNFSFADGNVTSIGRWKVETFIRMDSSSNRSDDNWYPDYSNGNVIGKIETSDQTSILLWCVDYASEGQCPWSAGTYVFGTIFTVLGEESEGGDPPVWGESFLESEIKDSTISLHRTDVFVEEDYETGEEIIEETEMNELLKWTPYGIEVLEKEEL